jgi:hypothetical protein
VIIDVDGTLLDTNYLHFTAWWEAFRERGHDIRCADVHQALGMGSDELVERVLGRPDRSVIDVHSRYDQGKPEILEALSWGGTRPSRGLAASPRRVLCRALLACRRRVAGRNGSWAAAHPGTAGVSGRVRLSIMREGPRQGRR